MYLVLRWHWTETFISILAEHRKKTQILTYTMHDVLITESVNMHVLIGFNCV